jgi:hypothetical protein
MSVMNSDEIRKAHEAMQPEVVRYNLRGAQSQKIFNALVKIKDSQEFKSLTPARRRIIEKSILNMRLSGVALSGESKTRDGSTLMTVSMKSAMSWLTRRRASRPDPPRLTWVICGVLPPLTTPAPHSQCCDRSETWPPESTKRLIHHETQGSIGT